MNGALLIKVNPHCYIRDPFTSDLGKSIISEAIVLVDETGYESFTFKKLSDKIGTTEASVYRYFLNKRQLLVFLLNWYWQRLEHILLFKLNNLNDAEQKLSIFVDMLTQPLDMFPFSSKINEESLYRIVARESAKAFMSKAVDSENQEGYFASYKRLNTILTDILHNLRAGYPFPASLAATIIDASHNIYFYREHLPTLTETKDRATLRQFLYKLGAPNG